MPFVPILIGVWSSTFLRMWDRRQSELAFTLDVVNEEFTRKQRSQYYGKVKLEEVTNKIIKFNNMTPFKKRFIVSCIFDLLRVRLLTPANSYVLAFT